MASLLDTDPDEPLPPEPKQNITNSHASLPQQDASQDSEPDRPRERPSGAAGFGASYFAYPVKYAVSSALRRLSSDPPYTSSNSTSRFRDSTPPPSGSSTFSSLSSFSSNISSFGAPSIPVRAQTPTYLLPRHDAPFQPPPLTPLSLSGYNSSTRPSAQLLTRQLAEEIRLLVPPRLQITSNWRLLFSLEQDGASLKTLYTRCSPDSATSPTAAGRERGGCVLVVRDNAASVFGAYLTDPPRPSNGHYYGHGECFLWKAAVLPALNPSAPLHMEGLHVEGLPPLPSEDTTHATRMTTVGGRPSRVPRHHPPPSSDLLAPDSAAQIPSGATTPRSGATTPDRIRFKAFPYSGENDYLIFCQTDFLSVGGGDGHYGLWLDSALERGVSQPCPTFGNEGLGDDDSGKFDVLGVEVWWVGS